MQHAPFDTAARNTHTVGAQTPLVAVSILNWNGWRDTTECVRSIEESNCRDRIAVIVENGSTDGSMGQLRRWLSEQAARGAVTAEYDAATARDGGRAEAEAWLRSSGTAARIILIRSEQNLGFPGGHNLAIDYLLNSSSPPEYVLLLNNDATLDPGCISEMVATAHEAGAGIVGALMRSPATGELEDSSRFGSAPLLRQFFQPFLRWPRRPRERSTGFWPAFWVSGAAMLLSVKALLAVKAETGHCLDSLLFLYGEELELSCRFRACGYETVVAGRAIVNHGEAASSGGRYNPIAYYYSNRNRALLARRLLPLPLLPVFTVFDAASNCCRIAKTLCMGRFRSAWAIASGTIDGYLGKVGKWRQHDSMQPKPRSRTSA